MNLLLFVFLMMISLVAVLLAYRHSIVALYVVLSGLYIITNITAGKIAIVDFYLFAVPASVAAPLYASIFLGTDIIAETVGRRAALYAVLFGFVSVLCLLVTGFLIGEIDAVPNNPLAGALDVVFGFTPRLVLGSLVAYVVSQNFDILVFHYLKKIHGDRLLWLRNNASTILSQFVDSLIVFSIAFAGVIDNWVEVMLSTYVIKVVVALADTPWLYLARRSGSQQKIAISNA